MFKKLKENTFKSPKTTKKGLWYSVFTLIAGVAVTEIAKKNPDLAQIITEYQFEIYSVLALAVTAIAGKFAQKKDDE